MSGRFSSRAWCSSRTLGLAASEARHSIGLTTYAMDVEGALSSATLGEEDIAAGRFDEGSVRMVNGYGYNQTKPNQSKTRPVLVTDFTHWFGFGFTIQKPTPTR
jgi:hypothetical protein